jgi:predicted dehydrogenase
MQSIGFIDHYLNNFHANLYARLIREGKHRDDFAVTCAYGEAEWQGVDTDAWCERNGVRRLATPAEVVAAADCVIVLSPNNPERHLELSREALASGKPCYIDKTFAPDYATARAMVDLARAHGTPMFSTSALRYAPEIHEFLGGIGVEHPARAVAMRGPNEYEVYAVHVYEPLVMLLGPGAEAMHYFGDGDFMLFSVRYPDGRLAAVNMFRPWGSIGDKSYGHPFEASVMFDCGATSFPLTMDRVFADLVDSICVFFQGTPAPAPAEDTLEVMALIETGRKAMQQAGEWIGVDRG